MKVKEHPVMANPGEEFEMSVVATNVGNLDDDLELITSISTTLEEGMSLLIGVHMEIQYSASESMTV